MMIYEAIISSASFGRLAAAVALVSKRVLLVDRKPIGIGQTSVCGTLYGVIEALDLHDSLRQRLPVRLIEAVATLVHWPRALKPVMRAHQQACDPAALAAAADSSKCMSPSAKRRGCRQARFPWTPSSSRSTMEA
jgi:hypothetical protein